MRQTAKKLAPLDHDFHPLTNRPCGSSFVRSCCSTLSTSLLCLLDDVYPQHLEGEESVIDALFASIGRDGRRAFAI